MIELIRHITKSGNSSPFWIVVDGLDRFKVASFDCARRLKSILLRGKENESECQTRTDRSDRSESVQYRYSPDDQSRYTSSSTEDSDVDASQENICLLLAQRSTKTIYNRPIRAEGLLSDRQNETSQSIELVQTLERKKSSISGCFSVILSDLEEVRTGSARIVEGSARIVEAAGDIIYALGSFFGFTTKKRNCNLQIAGVCTGEYARQSNGYGIRNITADSTVIDIPNLSIFNKIIKY